jgi:hypothetical protein
VEEKSDVRDLSAQNVSVHDCISPYDVQKAEKAFGPSGPLAKEAPIGLL